MKLPFMSRETKRKKVTSCPNDEVVCAYEWNDRLFRTKKDLEAAKQAERKRILTENLSDFIKYGFHPTNRYYMHDYSTPRERHQADRLARWAIDNLHVIEEVIKFEQEDL